MASVMGKGVSSLLTPIKTRVNLRSSPINIQTNGKSLSASLKKHTLKPPYLKSGNRLCKTVVQSNKTYLSESRSPLHFTAARCLFSTPQSSKPPTSETCSAMSLVDTYSRHDDELLSFDTPFRRAFSAKEYYTKISENFILGRGSYGVVVKGRYKNKHIAVKIVSHCRDHSKEELKSEVNALNLKHPNISQIFKVIVGTDTGFVFMELFGDTNLEHLLQCEIIRYSDKLRYLWQVANALQYCHNNGVLHLDVKPKNIIVNTKDRNCQLCDFGSSVTKSDASNMIHSHKGTLKYTAPELLKGEKPTEKSDVYSFGVTMWQTIYQEVPYDKEDLQQVVYKVVKFAYRPVTRKATHNPTTHHLYEACWQADPQKRPTTSQIIPMIENLTKIFLR